MDESKSESVRILIVLTEEQRKAIRREMAKARPIVLDCRGISTDPKVVVGK